MIPVNLGQRQMRIGMGQGVPPELAQMLAQQQPQGAAPEQAQSTNPRSMAVADVLSNPVSVESGHWGEALAEALGSGIRGRAMRDVYGREQEQEDEDRQRAQEDRQREIDQQTREQKEVAGQRMGYAEALQAYQGEGGRDAAVQALGRSDPQTALSLALQPQAQPDWQTDPVTGQIFRITPQGQRVNGEGRIGVRPTGGGSGERAPPAGYESDGAGGLRPIRGGPADQRQSETGRRFAASLDTAIRNRENVLTAIQDAQRIASTDGGTTGLQGQAFRGMGGNRAYDLNALVDTIVGNIGFEALQEMRMNSPTGGALGQVAVRELELLQRTVSNLDTAQSQEQFLRNLNLVRQQYERTLQSMRAARAQFDESPAPTPQSSGGQAPRVIELEP